MNILILDIEGLAEVNVIRSFGRSGCRVLAAFRSGSKSNAASKSRYCAQQLEHPDPRVRPASFQRWVLKTIVDLHVDAVVPVSADSIACCLKFEQELDSKIKLLAPRITGGFPLPAAEACARALEAGCPVPPTVWSEGTDHRSPAAFEDLQYPLLLSMDASTNDEGGRHRFECHSREALERGLLLARRWRVPFMLQEQPAGVAEVAFLLCVDGEIAHSAAYRCLHQLPCPGQPSSLREACNADDHSRCIQPFLQAVNYSGLARAEFVRGTDGRLRFITLSANPWRSIAAVTQAGADLPAWWLDSVAGSGRTHPQTLQTSPTRRSYPALAGELAFHRFRRLQEGGRGSIAAALGGLLADPHSRNENFQWSDPAPSIAAGCKHFSNESHWFAQNHGAAVERFKSIDGSMRRLARSAGRSVNGSADFPLRVFMFHAVIERPLDIPHFCFVDHELFRQQLETIAQAYRVMPLSAAVAALQRGALTEPTAAITFDDGFRNNFTLAFPQLQELALPASIFVSTGFVDSDQPPWFCRILRALGDTRVPVLNWSRQHFDLSSVRQKQLVAGRLMDHLKSLPQNRLEQEVDVIETLLQLEAGQGVAPDSPFRMLSTDEIRAMAESGLVEFGGHSVSHAILSQLTGSSLRQEIEHCIAELTDMTGGVIEQFAYPNGRASDFDHRCLDVLQERGISIALTAMAGSNPRASSSLTLHRDAVGPFDTRDRFKSRVENMLAVDHHLAGGVV